MIAGYHAPPAGAYTGVADYARTLLEALRDLSPQNGRLNVEIYHLGNNRLHEDIYAKALATPGIVVLHDAVLNHFLLGTLDRDHYVEEFVYNYGEWSRHVGEELWRERTASSVDPRYFRYPMLRRIVENARAVIVHNPGAAAMAREHGAGNVHVIPHFYQPRDIPDAAATERFRQRIGVSPGATMFGIFGYLRETKRVLPCINAFRRLHAVCPDTALLIAGEVVSGDLSRLLTSETPHPAIHRLGHLSEPDFLIAAAAVDCCLNLRYPAAGETSGIAMQLMGIGKPVIVTEGPETADFPIGACLRVSADQNEVAALFEQMALIAGFPAIAGRIGATAAEHIGLHHSLQDAAKQFWNIVELTSDS